MLQAQTKEIIMLQRLNALPTTRNKDLILAAMGVALMFICAQASIPLRPVPITLQTLGVLLIGLTYTPRQAFYAMGSYILLGALGAPVFSNLHGGLEVLLSPRGGYIFGWLFAAVAMAYLARLWPAKAWWGFMLNSLVGSIIIYACGLPWLARFIGWQQAWMLGFVPFIIPGIFKAFLLSGAIYGVKFFRAK
jgi:biotin transport system substrate-specific component